jgi:tRNA1Val (adenine37-N6)-methyltransferase
MERMDDLQHNGLVLYQDADYACFNADALLLTGFLRLTQKDTVVELGSGTGVICVLGANNTGARFCGVERQARLVELSRKSAEKNGQDIRFLCADVAQAPALLGRGTFSAVVMNPPYFTSGEESPNGSRSAARHDAGDTLGLFLNSAFALLNNGGRVFLIYPASALTDLMQALRAARLEPKRMQTVYSGKRKDALRVLIEAKKLARPGLQIGPPIFLNE